MLIAVPGKREFPAIESVKSRGLFLDLVLFPIPFPNGRRRKRKRKRFRKRMPRNRISMVGFLPPVAGCCRGAGPIS
jgi:hypothetical protein